MAATTNSVLAFSPGGITFVNCRFQSTAQPEALPFFLDPQQIKVLTNIDWDKRVGDRIRTFETWGRELLG